MEELAEQIKGGMMDFDVVIASPDAMRVVGTLGSGAGSAGPDAEPQDGHGDSGYQEAAVKNAKAGQMRFRSDKNGIVHGGIGKVNPLSRMPSRATWNRGTGRPKQGQASLCERCLCSQGDPVYDHGSRRHDRPQRDRFLSSEFKATGHEPGVAGPRVFLRGSGRAQRWLNAHFGSLCREVWETSRNAKDCQRP